MSTFTKVGEYTYDSWCNVLTKSGALADINPFRYRSYYQDPETNFYYLQSRYYDPAIGRFINADNQLSTSDFIGANLFAYCGNNPINRIDPTGEAWYHWVIGAAVVAACAVATVVTCGGFAAAATAVCMVGNGLAAATTASTVAAAAFVGSATAYGAAVLVAATNSSSVKEFNAQGNWGTVAATAGGALLNGASAYTSSKSSISATSTPNTPSQSKVSASIENSIIDLPRRGSALKTDPYHAFPDIVDNYAGCAVSSTIDNGTLYQLQGSLNGVDGRFEWIVQDQFVTHRLFVEGGGINGIPIRP